MQYIVRSRIWIGLLIVCSCGSGMLSAWLTHTMFTSGSNYALIISIIVMIWLLTKMQSFFRFRSHMTADKDQYLFLLSLLPGISLLKFRESNFQYEWNCLDHYLKQWRIGLIDKLIPGLQALITAIAVCYVLGSYQNNLILVVIVLSASEIFGQLMLTKQHHKLEVANLFHLREFEYAQSHIYAPHLIREYKAVGALSGLQHNLLQSLDQVHRYHKQSYRMETSLLMLLRMVQGALVLGMAGIGLTHVGLSIETSLGAHAVAWLIGGYHLVKAGQQLGKLPGLMYASRLKANEIKRLKRAVLACKKGPVSTSTSKLQRMLAGPGLVLLTGPNGSGKSTCLLQLLDELRNREDQCSSGILFQGFGLFQASILNNLTLFQPPERIPKGLNQALKLSGFDQIMQKYGWNLYTEIGEEYGKGRGISMGEWQLLAIARALYQANNMLILDEPDAFIDQEAKNNLAAVIKQLVQQGQKVVLISHSRQFIQQADYVLEF